MSDRAENGFDLPLLPARAGQRRRNRRLALAAGVLVSAVLGGAAAALLTDPDRSPTAAAPSAVSPAATPSPAPAAASAAPAQPSPAPPSVAATPDVPGLTEVSGDLVFFRTPSGNIGCQMTPTSAACDLLERNWEPPPRPADCELDYGQGVFVDGDRSGVTCAGDTQIVPDAPVLAYGTGWVLGSIRCLSAEDGVTCTNVATARGFSVSRDRFRLL